MSNPQTRLESIRPSVREDLRYVTELLGREPEPNTDFRVWNDATSRLQKVTAAFEALNDPALEQLGRACLEFSHLLASQQFADASEASQRLLACLQILADHSHRVASSQGGADDHWQATLLQALGAESGESKAANDLANEGLQNAAAKHVQSYQAALLNWLTGRDTDQSLAQLTRILHNLRPAMSGTPIATLADLTEAWRDRKTPIDGHARQCLSRAERLLQQMAAGEDYEQRATELQQKLQPLVDALPGHSHESLNINISRVNNSGYWRPPHPAPADQEAWTGLASALRDDLRYVIESLDVATRVAPTQAPDMRVVADRIRTAGYVLAATYLEDWSQQLQVLADEVASVSSRSECLRLAEKIQDVMACLEPEVIQQRQQTQASDGSVSTQDAVAELSRTAVVDAALGSIARLSARFEIIATSDYRPNNLRPTEEIDALWGAARVLDWRSLSDATAWLRDCAKDYLSNPNSDDEQKSLLSTLLTGCVVVERFLQTVRLPWPDIALAENEMLNALQQLAPNKFSAA
jgi:hypothetical protein